ncbi:hypothetical protein [Peribacillus simplex]|uniref:hypothetical protein n=1 Tax=Peribacillus simplex TaxID=1478 RepID=UPI003D26EA55
MGKQAYYNKYKRDKEAKKFYNSSGLKKCHAVVLAGDNHSCQEWWKKRITPVDMVHHI